jgi:hypothetical protein
MEAAAVATTSGSDDPRLGNPMQPASSTMMMNPMGAFIVFIPFSFGEFLWTDFDNDSRTIIIH